MDSSYWFTYYTLIRSIVNGHRDGSTNVGIQKLKFWKQYFSAQDNNTSTTLTIFFYSLSK